MFGIYFSSTAEYCAWAAVFVRAHPHSDVFALLISHTDPCGCPLPRPRPGGSLCVGKTAISTCWLLAGTVQTRCDSYLFVLRRNGDAETSNYVNDFKMESGKNYIMPLWPPAQFGGPKWDDMQSIKDASQV